MNRTASAPGRSADDAVTATDPQHDTAVRWANVIVWTLAAVLGTGLGIVLIPLHMPGGFLIPIAPVIALAANYLLPKALLIGTGWQGARFVPAVVWAVMTIGVSIPTSEGDILIPSNSHSSAVGLAYLGFGALGAMLGIVLAASPMRRSRRTG